jgi:hypothetical protein
MANPNSITLPPITILAEAAAALVAEAGTDRPRVNALNKACLALHEGVAPTITHGGFLVESRTRAQVHRVDSVYGCGCEAGQAGRSCWHQALIAIIEHAQMRAIPMSAKIAAARSLQRAAIDTRQAAAQAALDECFA